MKADRKSAISQWSLPFDSALEMEGRGVFYFRTWRRSLALNVLHQVVGRGGRFDDHTDKAYET